MSQPSTNPKKSFAKWRTFAAVGGASLAAATNADAGIVYSGVIDQSLTIPYGNSSALTKSIAVTGANAVFQLKLANVTVFGNLRAAFAFFQGQGGINFATTGTNRTAVRYGTGAVINPVRSTAAGVFASFTSGGRIGAFATGTQTGFVGFKLSNGDIGWAKVSVQNNNALAGVSDLPSSLTLISYAYSDVAGASINAGDTGQTAISTPEPATMALALLAAGATGLAALRKAKAKLAV